MRIEAVDHIEQLGIFGGLHRQIGCAAAAENQNVNFVRHLLGLFHRVKPGRRLSGF